ncbi:MAG: TonB-dependent receptor plug domain-containing protein [Opitutales bacterium]|nr:TonB-dependent receptor plug domain-containing protein [Opitutales bacterium]
MKSLTLPRRAAAACFLGLLTAFAAPLTAQDDDAVYELSPFEVVTDGDRGYYAANAVTGSRLSVLIQDMPLTIEVLTSEFIRDTGSSDLRESLRYSAGIVLQSQNDAFSGGGTGGFGNVNNPEGSTANKTDSSFKIRGFVTNNTLRKGFRRQHATDTINIERVEVVRGPSALLYGVGNFGGVVNYLPKAPLPHSEQHITLGYGSDEWRRATLDVTGPLPGNLGYRLTAAYEDREHFTDFNTHDRWFISPVLEWSPFRRTKITLDFEAGKAHDNGIGFLSVRSPTITGIPIFQADRLETFGMLEFEGKNPRTFRWSGPDTFLITDAWNFNLDWQQGIGEKINLMVGYNHSDRRFRWRDVFGGIATNSAAPRAQPHLATIRARQIIDGRDTDVVVDVDNAVLQYNWVGSEEHTEWDQVRAEVNLRDRYFEGSRWLNSEHNLLVGFSYELQQNDNVGFGTAGSPDNDNFRYRNPTDPEPIRFDTQYDGSPNLPFRATQLSGDKTENTGLYLVYSGRFINERLFLIGGIRRDETSSKDGFFELIGSRAGRQFFPDTTVSKTTTQFGASFEITKGINIFALQSEGVEPNFDGQRDGIGQALESSVAKAREVGLKFDFFDSRLSATVSAFRIEREGVPFSYWWAPAPIKGNFDRNADIVYRLDEVNLERQAGNRYLEAAADEWAAARASGAIFEQMSEDGRSEFTYINASTPEGAAYLDAVFAALKDEFALPREERTDNDPWPGFLYEGRDDPVVNTAAQDWAEGDFFQAISDKSEGIEVQMILSPRDNLQIVLNYSHVKREVVNPGNFVTYDYAEGNWDRWASWYFPNSNWGLAGVDPEVAYPGGDTPGLPNSDTASWSGIGWGKGEALDDTPKHVVSAWASYTFEEFLDGLQLGLGGTWESKREYASAFTSAGQRKQNETGETIKAFTDPRLTINAMVKYSWNIREHDAYIQLNVDNLFNDRSQYGLIRAPGMSWRMNFGLSF